MPQDDQSGTWAPRQIKDLLESAHKLAVLVATAVSLALFGSGNRVVSYVFIAVATLLLNVLIWRTSRRRFLAAAAVAILSVAALAWIGVNGRKDYRRAKGYLFRVARPDELLIIVADFDHRGGEQFDVQGRIRERLQTEASRLTDVNLRIDRSPPVADESAAIRLGELHRAAAVVWGWYDAAGIIPRYTAVLHRRPFQDDSHASLRPTEVGTDHPQFMGYIRRELADQVAFLVDFSVGQLYYFAGKYDDALRALAFAKEDVMTAANVWPGIAGWSSLLLVYEALALRGKGDLDSAITVLTRAIELDTLSASAYLQRGIAYSEKGQFDQALHDYEAALRRAPTRATAFIARGDAYFRIGETDRALADFSTALDLDSTLGVAYYNRGVVRSHQGLHEESIADYTRSIRLDPAHASAYNNRGNAYRIAGRLRDARRDFDEALDIDPGLGTAYLNRGIAYFDMGSFDRAIADYTRAIVLDSTDDLAYNNRGNAYRKKRVFEMALVDLDKATELNPQLGGAYLNRGLLYLETDSLKAETEFERCLRVAQDAEVRGQCAHWIKSLKAKGRGGTSWDRQSSCAQVGTIAQHRGVNGLRRVGGPRTAS